MERISSQPLRGFRPGSAEERKKAREQRQKRASGENCPQPSRSFSHFFSFRCLHYLGAWNMLNSGSRAGHLSRRSDHRAQKSYLWPWLKFNFDSWYRESPLFTLESSLRSRRLEVFRRKKERACEGDTRGEREPSRAGAPSLLACFPRVPRSFLRSLLPSPCYAGYVESSKLSCDRVTNPLKCYPMLRKTAEGNDCGRITAAMVKGRYWKEIKDPRIKIPAKFKHAKFNTHREIEITEKNE